MDGTAYWGQQGQQLGGCFFDVTHPNAGGQMVYTAEELGLSYILPFPGFN